MRRADLPSGVRDLLNVRGLGVETALRLLREAGVGSARDLVVACEENRAAVLRELGVRKRAGLLAAARAAADREPGVLLATALEMARLINGSLKRAGLDEGLVVGDARRGVELVAGLTMLVRGPANLRDLTQLVRATPACTGAEALKGDAIHARFDGGGPVALQVVAPERFVEALIRATGSAGHVRWLTSQAKRKGGLSAICGQVTTEAEAYAAIGVPFAPPELREGPTPHVPDLVDAVAGVFHVHTTWSDGAGTMAEMVEAARGAGLSYVGISEHSKAASYARGLDAGRLREQARAVADARRGMGAFVLLHGVEVDILADGSLDLDDALLAELDFVVASVHTDLDMEEADMTRRLVRAVSHPLVTILGHPTGRLLLARKGFAFDVEAVASAAVANDTFLEINSNPQRLDLSDALVRRAAACGARFAIDPDAHSPRGVRDTALGLAVARRAGLQSSQVLNARDADDVTTYLGARREKAKRSLALA